MTIDVNYVLERLSIRQIESGGYYGMDITKLSNELGVTPQGLREQTVLYHTLKGWSGPKVILTFQIFAYLSLREDLREASTVGIISPQLVLPCLSHRHFKTHHRMVQPEIKYYRRMKFAKNAYTLVVQYYIRSSTR